MASTSSTSSAIATEVVIVTFTSRLYHDDARKVIAQALANVDAGGMRSWWTVVRRDNPGGSMDSDFALLRLRLTLPLQRTRALDALRRHSAVSLLSPERLGVLLLG